MRKNFNFFSFEILHLLLVLLLKFTTNALHLKGTFNTNEYFKFITRFGIQATDSHNPQDTQGYIYGNITLVNSENLNFIDNSTRKLPPNTLIMLTLLDYNFFIDYYTKRLIKPETTACSMMFEKIAKSAYFFQCNENSAGLDFIRRVPCPNNLLCADEDDANNVIKNFQFTFRTNDLNQARFWYISLVACVRDTKTCEWKYLNDFDEKAMSPASTSTTEYNQMKNSTMSSQTNTYSHIKRSSHLPSFTLAYDIWLVNGHPSSSFKNRFEHQFSYELHDIFEIYLFSFLIYSFVIPFIGYRLYWHFHYLYLQLFAYVGIELTCRLLSLIHNIAFSFDGCGVIFLKYTSDFLEVLASSVLILILISIAKGWTIRSKHIQMTKKSYLLGFFLQSTLVFSHMISLITTDQIFNTNSYETTAGYVEMSVRAVFMLWFLYELKLTSESLESIAFQKPLNNATATFSNEEDTSLECEEIEKNGKKYTLLQHQPNDQPEDNSNRERDNEIKFKKFQKFYLHYGACCLVWFIYLPILIFITSFVSELYRLRLVSGIRYFVNFISVVVLCYIMWSPKTPLRLPGKKLPVENDSDYFLGSNYHPYFSNDDEQERQEPKTATSISDEVNNVSKTDICKEC